VDLKFFSSKITEKYYIAIISLNFVSTPCLYKKTVKFVCYNFVKFLPTVIIFDKKMAETIKLCELHWFFISPNLCQRTTVRNTDVQIVTLCGDYLYHIAHLCIINSTEGATWFNNFVA